MTKVSVVMPVFESEEFIEESLDSLLDQTLDDFEIICVYDPSEDSSLEILEKYETENSQISVIVNDERKGLPESLNIGLGRSEGKYIARNDSDDISKPERLEKQFNYLEKNDEVFLCGTDIEKINEKGDFIRKSDFPKEIGQNLLDQRLIVTSSLMWRNSGEYKYRDKFSSAEDLDRWLRLLSENEKMHNLDQCLVKYRIRPGSITNNQLRTSYFAKMAEKFYRQRVQTGKDSYEDWAPDPPRNNKMDYRYRLIPEYLISGQRQKALEELKEINTYHKYIYFPFCTIPKLYSAYRYLRLNKIKEKAVKMTINYRK